MGRPSTWPLVTLPVGMCEAILAGGRRPGSAELRVDPGFADQHLPGRSRIAALLSAEKLTRRYQKLSSLPTPAIQAEAAPHDEWELDAVYGACTWRAWARVCLISMLDVVSRLKVESYPCLDTTNPPLQAYQLMLRRIEVSFIRKRCPTDHARIERTHQTMTLQALLGQRWLDQTSLCAGLDARRAIRECAYSQ